MKTNTVIAQTKKGHRIFLESTSSVGFMPRARYSVEFIGNFITLTLTTEGKTRGVTPSKGGVIDLESKKVTQWAQDSTEVLVRAHTADGIIVIERVVA